MSGIYQPTELISRLNTSTNRNTEAAGNSPFVEYVVFEEFNPDLPEPLSQEWKVMKDENQSLKHKSIQQSEIIIRQTNKIMILEEQNKQLRERNEALVAELNRFLNKTRIEKFQDDPRKKKAENSVQHNSLQNNFNKYSLQTKSQRERKGFDFQAILGKILNKEKQSNKQNKQKQSEKPQKDQKQKQKKSKLHQFELKEMQTTKQIFKCNNNNKENFNKTTKPKLKCSFFTQTEPLKLASKRK